ncbi:MAG: cyclic pyranopterin monophosphate synthase MoaC [Candidatus Eisenbacteria bacterium]|nr:cyclic pyranopterin monophosphate synthase MoaC [Candidatus Eisenbacteria bacterium]
MSERRLSHSGPDGRARMVDLSGKEATDRYARAEATVRLGPETARLLAETGAVAKGNVLETARIAGVMAAKRTPDLIPLCHPIPIDHVDVETTLDGERVRITCVVSSRSRTGVEMEAMTAAAAAALTVYDMCKSAGKGIVIETVRLLEKRGGKSGEWSAGG